MSNTNLFCTFAAPFENGNVSLSLHTTKQYHYMDFLYIPSAKKGKEDFGNIYARVRVGGLNKKYALGLLVKSTEWDRYRLLKYNNNSIMTSIGISYGQFVSYLTQVKAALETNFDPSTAQRVIKTIRANVVLKTDLEDLSAAGNKVKLRDYIKEYIEKLRTGKIMKQGRATKVSKGHIKNISAVLSNIIAFEVERHCNLTLDDVTMDFQQRYVAFLLDHGRLPNTIKSQLAILKTIMNFALSDKLTKCEDVNKPHFVIESEEVDQVYLEPKQINQLIEMDLSSQESVLKILNGRELKPATDVGIKTICPLVVKGLSESRDIFVVGCLTGQRVSDYSRINASMIVEHNGMKFIDIVQKKTGKRVLIPYDVRIGQILDKYNGALPKKQERSLNRNLRALGEILGWTWKPNLDESRKGWKYGERFCDMISSHTARRSFATNAYAAGVPLASIMAVTGHGSELTLRKYLKLQATEKAIIATKDFAGVIMTKKPK